MAILREPIPGGVLEMICNILGNTNDGLTGSDIHRLLLQARIEDVTQEGVSKRRNLFNSFISVH